MDNRELDEIDASARAIIRRAYDLGRSEALKRVVEVLSDDRPSAEQLALMPPNDAVTETAPPVEQPVIPVEQPVMNGAVSSEKTPWWVWKVK